MKLLTFSGKTSNDIEARKVLEAAIGKVTAVLLIGEDTNGKWYFASSVGDKREMLWWIEEFKQRLLSGEWD